MKLAIVLTKPPYGSIQAAEALRHTMGAVGEEIDVSLLLVDGGIWTAKQGHSVQTSGYTDLAETLKDIVDMGGKVFIDKASLRDSGLDLNELVQGLQVVNGYELSQIIADSDKTMIF